MSQLATQAFLLPNLSALSSDFFRIDRERIKVTRIAGDRPCRRDTIPFLDTRNDINN